VVHYVEHQGETVPASEAVEIMGLFGNQELALRLEYVVVVPAQGLFDLYVLKLVTYCCRKDQNKI